MKYIELLIKNVRKISWFDRLLMLGIIFCGVFFFLFFYRQATYIKIRVKVTDQDVLYATTTPQSWYANRFEVGDSVKDALGRKITEIVNVERFNLDSSHKAVYLDLNVRAVYDTRTGLYAVQGKNVNFGTTLRFNLAKVAFNGLVTDFPNSDQKTQTKMIEMTALARNIEPYVANYVKVGDEVHDSRGTLLAKVINVNVSPAEQVTQTIAGDLLLRYNPLYKDITFKLLVRTQLSDNELYLLDTIPIKIGEVVPLNFNNISVYPFITQINN